jgi:hypothetical protein
MSILLLPFLAGYFLLLLPRAAFVILFDRYLLEIVALLLIYALRWHQERVSLNVPAVAMAALAIFALLGVAATHDLFAIDRAEVRLANELQAAGVPRTQIRGGFDFDSVTQVQTMGYINDPHLLNPPGSYLPPRPRPAVQDIACAYPFLVYLPALDPRYVISADPKPCLAPAPFAPVSYRTWLPWATRQLFVGTVRHDLAVTPGASRPATSPQ